MLRVLGWQRGGRKRTVGRRRRVFYLGAHPFQALLLSGCLNLSKEAGGPSTCLGESPCHHG